MKVQNIKIDKVHLNEGQIEGLPKNPRQWTQTDIDRIAKSLQETPELFEMRPCIVKEQEGEYYLLAGNLRYTGAKHNGDTTIPCIVVPADMSVDKMKEIVLKDNGTFGRFDFDALANEWDDLSLTDWGIPAWGTKDEVDENIFEQMLPSEDKEKDITISIIVPKELEDKVSDIKASLALTLEEWQGCEVK